MVQYWINQVVGRIYEEREKKRKEEKERQPKIKKEEIQKYHVHNDSYSINNLKIISVM